MLANPLNIITIKILFTKFAIFIRLSMPDICLNFVVLTQFFLMIDLYFPKSSFDQIWKQAPWTVFPYNSIIRNVLFSPYYTIYACWCWCKPNSILTKHESLNMESRVLVQNSHLMYSYMMCYISRQKKSSTRFLTHQ